MSQDLPPDVANISVGHSVAPSASVPAISSFDDFDNSQTSLITSHPSFANLDADNQGKHCANSLLVVRVFKTEESCFPNHHRWPCGGIASRTPLKGMSRNTCAITASSKSCQCSCCLLASAHRKPALSDRITMAS